MARKQPPFDFLNYLAANGNGNGHPANDRVPSLTDLSKEQGVSITSLREQLEVAKALGLVEVRPRTGIRRLPYSFAPAVYESLAYAIACDRAHFDEFAQLRKEVEKAFWRQAVTKLTKADHAALQELIERAWAKLHDTPIHLPHEEHRQLHLTIFSRLENPFVVGILEAYWDAYEDVGLNRYEALDYLEEVWQYHRKMVEAIQSGEIETSYKLMVEHMDLIAHRRQKKHSSANSKK